MRKHSLLILIILILAASIGQVSAVTISILEPTTDTSYNPVPRINVSVGSSSNLIYSWNGNHNITGCQSCVTYNNTYGEYDNLSEESIVSALHFNENYGTAAYDDYGINDGVLNVNVSYVDNCRFGPCLNFSGVGSQVVITDDPSLGNMENLTLSVWAKFYDVSSFRSIIRKKTDTGDKAVFGFDILASNVVRFFITNSTNDQVSLDNPSIVRVGTWYHIVGVKSPDTMYLYINGVLVNSRSVVGTVQDSTNDLCIGCYAPGILPALNFKGELDELLIFNRSFSQDEVRGLTSKYIGDEGQQNITAYIVDNSSSVLFTFLDDNIALGRFAYTSMSTLSGSILNINDGLDDTFFTAVSTMKKYDYIIVDLGKSYYINKLNFTWGGSPFDFLKYGKVSGSIDLSNWYDIEVTGEGDYNRNISFPPIRIRYMNITTSITDNAPKLNELKIYVVHISEFDTVSYNYYGGAYGALSITFDDAYNDTYRNTINSLTAHGYVATYHIPTLLVGLTLEGRPVAPWSVWQEASDYGMELSSHGRTHASLGIVSNATLEYELNGSMSDIIGNISGVDAVYSIAWPGGGFSDDSMYWAEQYGMIDGKIGGSPPTPRNWSDYYNSSSFQIRGTHTVSTESTRLNSSYYKGYWLVETIHLVNETNPGAYSWYWDPTTFNSYLDYLDIMPSTLWVSTYERVGRYIRERQTFSGATISNTSHSVNINYTTTLNPDIYSSPLTVKTKIPNSWNTSIFWVNQGDFYTRLGGSDIIEGEFIVYDIPPVDIGILYLNESNIFWSDVNTVFYANGTVGYNTTIYRKSNISYITASDFSVVPSVDNISVYIYTWSANYKQWNESSPNPATTTNHVIGDFTPNTSIIIKKNGVVWNTYTANSTGYISFTYADGYSEIQFEASGNITVDATYIDYSYNRIGGNALTAAEGVNKNLWIGISFFGLGLLVLGAVYVLSRIRDLGGE